MTEQTETTFNIQRIYTKDISFETPNVPEIFTKPWVPELNIELNTSSHKITEDNFEVSIRLTLTAKSNGEVAYICEVTQSGIFAIAGLNDAQRQHCLGAYCPNILFPYAREVVANLVGKASFQPIHLDPINFDALYADHIRKQSGQASIEGTEVVQ